jgi:hypothetical protein
MTQRSTQIDRRRFLRGAGALVALPFFESLGRRSVFASTPAVRPPLRMGIFTVTGGTVLESWKAPEDGPLDKLPSILRSLEFAKNDLLLLGNLSQSGRSDNVSGHEHTAFLHLTCADVAKREGGKAVAGISVDQFAAGRIGDQTLLPSLEIGLSTGELKFSFRSKNENVPYEHHPGHLFDRMFRGRKPVVPNWSTRAANLAKSVRASGEPGSYDQSVVDIVRDNARHLQRGLGRADRQKLDEYLSSVRSIETRIQRMEERLRLDALDELNPGPSKPNVPPSLTDGNPDHHWGNAYFEICRDTDRHAEYIELVSDLMVLAFQTDLTRVCTLAAGADEAIFHGVVTVGYERHCHTIEHQGNAGKPEDADPIAREGCRQIHAWYTGLFAKMVAKMKAIDEGGSTLLDNTMLLYTSYMSNGGHGTSDYPCLLVGNAQGTLKTGRQLSFQKDTPVANLYLEMLDRMGVAADEFGNSRTSSKAAYDGRLPGLV